MDILDEIVQHKRQEIAVLTSPIPSMREALLREGPSGIIAEFKRRAPSKGWINEGARAEEVPLSYEQNGAAALSILTDEKYFGGCDAFIRTARESGVTLPILYKNFVIDEVQLLQARACGASAVLLIAACLTIDECSTLIDKAHALGLEVLLEMHSEEELAYAALEPDMYGVNNRNLGTFVTDVNNSFRLAARLPQGACLVSESGISNPTTIAELRKVGFRGFLIGETFMKTADPGATLNRFVNDN